MRDDQRRDETFARPGGRGFGRGPWGAGPEGGPPPFGPGGRRAARGFGPRGFGPRGFGPPGFPGGFGGPWRARRGDVRAAILALLTEKPMHGYEVIGEIDQRTDGAWRPSPGSVYPTLQMLEDEGLVQAEEVDGKRRYALTEAGTTAAESADGPPPWEEVRDGSPEGAVELATALRGLMPAAQQVLRQGSPAQQAKAAEVVNEAKRRLYEVLGSE